MSLSTCKNTRRLFVFQKPALQASSFWVSVCLHSPPAPVTHSYALIQGWLKPFREQTGPPKNPQPDINLILTNQTRSFSTKQQLWPLFGLNLGVQSILGPALYWSIRLLNESKSNWNMVTHHPQLCFQSSFTGSWFLLWIMSAKKKESKKYPPLNKKGSWDPTLKSNP